MPVDFEFSNAFTTEESSEKGAWLQLKNEGGKKLFAMGNFDKPIMVRVLGPDSAIARRYTNKVQAQALKKATEAMMQREVDEATEAEMEEGEAEALARSIDLVTEWQNVLDPSGKPIECTRANRGAMFEKYRAIRGQIFTFHNERANFTSGSATKPSTDSSPTPTTPGKSPTP
jgi:hypothetical protein